LMVFLAPPVVGGAGHAGSSDGARRARRNANGGSRRRGWSWPPRRSST
jgi:hypothetical protein